MLKSTGWFLVFFFGWEGGALDWILDSALAGVASGAKRLAVAEVGELARVWVAVGLVHPVDASRPLPDSSWASRLCHTLGACIESRRTCQRA